MAERTAPTVEVVFEAPRRVRVREKRVSWPRSGDEVLVRCTRSAISAGTEMLAYRGELPLDIPLDESIGGYSERFAYPTAYGYCAVGVVAAVGGKDAGTDERVGRRVFAFRPHCSAFVAKAEELLWLPDNVSDEDALFVANVETALSLSMDAAPLVGERVAVIGQGVVGQLTAALLVKSCPLSRVVTVDAHARRCEASRSFAGVRDCVQAKKGVDYVATVRELLNPGGDDYEGADVCIEVSGVDAGLNASIECAGRGARVVIGSWYGSKSVSLSALGGRFHRSHMRLIASQVSSVPAALSFRWSKQRRMALAWELCASLQPSRLITHRIPVREAAEAFKVVDTQPEDALQVVLEYEDEQ